jgi:wobble nucleotide-excising tRNase
MLDPDSDELGLNQLSEGTRDQLFLALKLAMIQNRLDERKKLGKCSLPVIFDDILVQFDDQRAKAAFEIFQELAQKTQVIFLTHHEHLVQVATEALGEGKFGVYRLGHSRPENVEAQEDFAMKMGTKRRRKGDKPTEDRLQFPSIEEPE